MRRNVPKTARVVAGLAVLLLAVTASALLIKMSFTQYPGGAPVSAVFPDVGEGLIPNAEVDYRGVQVGKVASIGLTGDQALVGMVMEHGFQVPADAAATIRPKSLFGDAFVDLTLPRGRQGPYLGPGGRIASTGTAPELGDLISSSVPLLADLNPADLTTIIGQLSQAGQGEGPTIRAGLDSGSNLSGLLADTIQAQLTALDAFDRFQMALTPDAGSLNAISNNSNVGLPVFNNAEAAFQHALTTLQPLSEDLAQLLADYRPSIDTILTSGDNVTRVLVANQANISELVHGLYRYTFKFASARSPVPLPDGSYVGYFKNFIMFSQVNDLICGLIAPAHPGLSFLQPLQQVVAGAGSPINCSQYVSAFNAAQGAGAPAPGGAQSAPPQGSKAPATVPPQAPAVAKSLANQLFQGVGRPQLPAAPSSPATPGAAAAREGGALQSLLDNALGGGL